MSKNTPSPVSIRFTDAQRQLIKKVCEDEGLPMGGWVRRLALKAAKKRLREMRREEADERAA